MNEFVAKKLGEVLAFAQAGQEIFTKGETALKTVFPQYTDLFDGFVTQETQITSEATRLGTNDITLTKAGKTKEKLLKMAELYIGEEWDNPAELLEWLGFFEGAAVVHWKLVEGAAQALSEDTLNETAQRGIQFHSELLTNVGDTIKSYAEKKAVS